jgi:DNA-binding NarL/FixJ family response regulator
MINNSKEPEAIRLLAGICDSAPDTYEAAVNEARKYIMELRAGALALRMGRPCKLTTHQLSMIAKMAAEGKSQNAIAREVGISRDLVAHHLGSASHGCSEAMRYAMVEKRINL